MSPTLPLPVARRGPGSADVRHANLSRILRYLRDHGSSSRLDIAQGCGLGVSTMTDLIGELRSRRLVRELDAVPRPGAGRPTRPIAMDGEPWCVLAVQVELLEIRFACTTVAGVELWSERVPARLLHSGPEAGYALLQDALESQLRRMPADRGLVAVQVALPGYVATEEGTVGWSSVLEWVGLPLRDRLHQALTSAGHPGVAVHIAHDCHLAALHAVRAELGLPAGTVAVFLGGLREVGGAVVVDGEIFAGADGGAGEFGHANIDPNGPPCRCGRRGCLESLVGPARLLTQSGLVAEADVDDTLVREPLPALRSLVAAADAGDVQTLRALGEAGEALGVAVDDLIGTLNPHAVVLGGYLGMLQAHLLGPARERIGRRTSTQPFRATTVLPLDELESRVLAGTVAAACDACLSAPLQLTEVLASA